MIVGYLLLLVVFLQLLRLAAGTGARRLHSLSHLVSFRLTVAASIGETALILATSPAQAAATRTHVRRLERR